MLVVAEHMVVVAVDYMPIEPLLVPWNSVVD